MSSATFRGSDTIKANLRQFDRDWTKKKARGLRVVAQKVLAKSNEYIPKDSENAMESGRIVESETGRSVGIVYGDELSAAYILALHEHPSEFSPPSWLAAEASGRGIHWSEPGTGPKFLLRAFMEEAGSYLSDLGEELMIDKRVG